MHKMRWWQSTAVSVGAVALLSAGALPAVADTTTGGGPNNLVFATSTADSPTATRSAVHVTPYNGPRMNSTNLAVARASDCTGCRSVAVAFQGVILGSAPATFDPGNAAVATNSGCTGCVSFAFAYQDIVSTAGPAHLTPSGHEAIAGIIDQVQAVATSGEDAPSMCQELAGLAADFAGVLTAPGNLASKGQPVQAKGTFSAPNCPSFS